MEDVTLRVLRELREADLVLCEDTRRTRLLLDRHGIEGAHLLSYHRHNEARRTAEVLPRLLEGARVQFLGYLPRGERALEAVWRGLETWPDAIVAYESPQRLPAALATLARVSPDRPVAVCRELTKAFEEVVRGPAAEVAGRFADPPKGEITIVVGPAASRP